MQTSYGYIRGRGYEGQSVRQGRTPISGYPTIVGVKDGRVAVRDENSTIRNAFRLPTAAADITNTGRVLGVTAYEAMREPGDRPIGHPTALLQDDEVLLMAEGAVTEGEKAFVRFTAGGGGTELGAVRADADTATAAACPLVTFLETTSGAGMVRCRILVS